MATGGNAGDAPFMKQAPLPSREGKFYASEGAKILPGSVYPEIHPSKGNVGDAPGMKQSPGEGKLHTVQIWASPASYTGGDPKTLPGGDRLRTLSGDHPEAISGGGHPDTLSGRGRPDTLAGIDHPTTLAGVGPTIKSGGLMLAGGDPMVAAGYFSKIYTMAVKPPVLSHVPRTVESPVRLESPRDPRITILFRDFARRASASKRQNLKALQVKREDRSERKKLEEERLEFEEEKKQAFLSLEEERKQFEEYKKQFSQEAVVEEEEKKKAVVEEEEKKKAVAVEEEKKGTMLSTTVSKIDKADSNISLFEKLINLPKRAEKIGKTVEENTELVQYWRKKLQEVNVVQATRKALGALGSGSIWLFKDELKEWLGVRGGGPSEGSIGGESNGVMTKEGNAGGPVPTPVAVANGVGNGATSVPKVGSASNGAKVGASIGLDSGAGGLVSGAGGLVPGAGAADSVTGAVTGAVVADSAAATGGADSAAATGGADSATATGAVTGAPAGATPKGE